MEPEKWTSPGEMSRWRLRCELFGSGYENDNDCLYDDLTTTTTITTTITTASYRHDENEYMRRSRDSSF